MIISFIFLTIAVELTWSLYPFSHFYISLILLQSKEPADSRSRGANTSNHGGRVGDRYSARGGSNHFNTNGMWPMQFKG